MKKTRIEQRVENDWNAFSGDENLSENEIDFVGEFDLLKRQKTNVAGRFNVFTGFLKQAFLFFPGSFVLFYMSMATVFFVADLFTKDIFIPREAVNRLIIAYSVGLLSIPATWFGLGDWKKLKHSVIPASIITAGVSLGVIINGTENVIALSKKIMDDFGYAVYLFPLALIVPILAKGWIDKTSEEKFPV